MPPVKTKPYISPTQASMYLKCGEQYRRRYIEKHIIPPGISLVKGTSVHKGSELNFKQKVVSRSDMRKQTIVDYSVTMFEETIKNEGLSLNSAEESRGQNIVVAEAKDTTAVFAGLLMDKVAPKYQPIEVEENRFVELPTSTHDLCGIIDMKTDAGNIVDLKTSAKAWTQDRLDRDLQFTFYGLLDRVKIGEDPKPMILENLVSTKEPKNITLETHRGKEDFEILINRLNSVVDGINKGVFIPAAPDSWACDEKYCGYALTCRYYVRNKGS